MEPEEEEEEEASPWVGASGVRKRGQAGERR